jgi:MoxR-like ATPase
MILVLVEAARNIKNATANRNMDKELNGIPGISEKIWSLKSNIKKHVKGKDEVIDNCLCALFSKGHVLIEDIPGVGKTTLAHSLALSINLDFKRIQFTSDLLPSDIIGVSIYDQSRNEFVFNKGPIFANIVLADEINRTTPKTQSSLLEAMNESSVTVEGSKYELDLPFMVLATQNPFEYHGTYPLPESQLDRFAIRLSMGYPDRESEKTILSDSNGPVREETVLPVISAEDLLKIQEAVENVHIEEDVLDYLLSIVEKTRDSERFELGVSPRGAIILKRLAMARAVLEDRTYCIPDDVKNMVVPAFSHRIVLRDPTQSGAGNESVELLNLLREVTVPL